MEVLGGYDKRLTSLGFRASGPSKKSGVAAECEEGGRGLWRWLLSYFDVSGDWCPLTRVGPTPRWIGWGLGHRKRRASPGQGPQGPRYEDTTLTASMSLCGMGEAMAASRVVPTPRPSSRSTSSTSCLADPGRGESGGPPQPLKAHRPAEDKGAYRGQRRRVGVLGGLLPGLKPDRGSFLQDKGHPSQILGARTHEALLKVMVEALSEVTPWDAAGWSDHCGYEVEVQYL